MLKEKREEEEEEENNNDETDDDEAESWPQRWAWWGPSWISTLAVKQALVCPPFRDFTYVMFFPGWDGA